MMLIAIMWFRQDYLALSMNMFAEPSHSSSVCAVPSKFSGTVQHLVLLTLFKVQIDQLLTRTFRKKSTRSSESDSGHSRSTDRPGIADLGTSGTFGYFGHVAIDCLSLSHLLISRSSTLMTQPPPAVTQNADVRFLGKLLGDVIRAHGGGFLFQRIEAIRAASVDRFRGIANPRIPTAGLETLSLDETVAFVRRFMLFSMLANLAKTGKAALSRKGGHVGVGSRGPEFTRARAP